MPYQNGDQDITSTPFFAFSFLLKLDKDYNPVVLDSFPSWLGFVPNGGGNYTFAFQTVGYKLFYYNNSLNSVSRTLLSTDFRRFED